MNRPCRQYTFEQINCYADNELPQDLCRQMQAHFKKCPACRTLLKDIESVSLIFQQKVAQQVSSIDPAIMEKKIADKTALNQTDSPGVLSGLFYKHQGIKLAVTSALLVAGLFLFNTEDTAFSAGPSAIVKSVDTEFSSVMIIETQKEKHTIIWFSET